MVVSTVCKQMLKLLALPINTALWVIKCCRLSKAFTVYRIKWAANSKLTSSLFSIRLSKTMPTHSSILSCSWVLCLTCCAACLCKRLQLTSTLRRLTHCLRQLARSELVRLFTTHTTLQVEVHPAACPKSLNLQRAALHLFPATTWAVKLNHSLRTWAKNN